jgi:hypothetical protein
MTMKKINTNMKTIYTIALIVFALAGFSQAPQLINYQGIARNAQDQPIANQLLGLKFEIFQGTQTTPTFTETAQVTSNATGLFTWKIGNNSANGVSVVDWANGPQSLLVSIDVTGGTAYQAIGDKQMMVSVPYALNAHYASNVPPTVVNYTSGILTVNGVQTNISGAASAQTLTVLGTSVNGTTVGLVGGNTVTVPHPTITGSGATTVTPGPSGYDISSQQVTVNDYKPVPNSNFLLGLAQIVGTAPNYSVVVAPTFTYSQATGSLIIYNNPLVPSSSAYTYSYYITPDVNLTGPILNVGPLSNQVNLQAIAPWRTNAPPAAPNTVTLAAIAASVGIGVISPSSKLHVNGYTKLGDVAPAIQMEKITGFAAAANGSAAFAIPAYISQSKILSITVMVDASTGANFDWIHPNYTTFPGLQFTWRVSTQIIFVENTSGNSANIAGKPLRILITYEQ